MAGRRVGTDSFDRAWLPPGWGSLLYFALEFRKEMRSDANFKNKCDRWMAERLIQ
jgi:hypothetical protein